MAYAVWYVLNSRRCGGGGRNHSPLTPRLLEAGTKKSPSVLDGDAMYLGGLVNRRNDVGTGSRPLDVPEQIHCTHEEL